jgi:hypothetical protein
VCVASIEGETGRKWAPQLPETLERVLAASVAGYFELASAGNNDLNLVAFLQVERLNDCGWQPYGQTVSPL